VQHLATAISIASVGVAMFLIGVAISIRASLRPSWRLDGRLRMDPGLVVAVTGAVTGIFGLGDLAFVLLTSS
jgi:hypothetical protein